MFIIWRVEDDEAFRARYFAVVAVERIGTCVKQDASGAWNCVGSGRITEEQAEALKTEFDMYAGDDLPAWWVDKVEE